MTEDTLADFINKLNDLASGYHNQVCAFKIEQKELIDKMETHLNNDSPSKIFNIILECRVYRPNEDESSKQQY